MIKNKKVTIALAFLLTFMIGMGAGYLLRGGLNLFSTDQQIKSVVDIRDSRRMPDHVGRSPNEQDLRGRAEYGERGWGAQRRPSELDEQDERLDRRFERRSDPDDTREDWQRFRNEPRPGWPEEERHDFGRLRSQLQQDMNLSEETAEQFFSILERHRQEVREKVVEHQQTMRQIFLELRLELEEELSKILTPEQLEVWQEKYSPRMERFGRGRP